jgi:hypothetical protein
MSENTVKGAKDTKVKVFFQGLHVTHGILELIHNLIFLMNHAQFTTMR